MKKMLRTVIAAGIGLAAAMLLSFSSAAYTLESHTPDEIRAWYQAHPSDADTVSYVQKPVLTQPMDAGRLADASLQQACNALNLCRYIAGLPADVALRENYEQQAQAASLCLALNGRLSHEPPCPKGMPNALYQLAYTGAGRSNLSSGYATPAQALLLGQMADSDESNIRVLGHRRWILNPDMAYTGIGFTNQYSVCYAFDGSRQEQFTGDYIAWPPQNMPYELYKEPSALFVGKEWYAFSVTLGQDYDKPSLNTVTVDLTSKKLGKTFHFSKANNATPANYLNVDTSGYGIPNCIIFNPGRLFDSDDELTVKVSGIYKGGKAAPISYPVKFFRLNQNVGQSQTAVLESDTVTVKPGDKKVPVTVRLTENPGISSLDVTVSFFPKFKIRTIDQIRPGSLSPIDIMTYYRGSEAGISGSISASGVAYTKEGTLMTLDLDVPDDLEAGTYVMQINVNALLDINGKPLEYQVTNGAFVVEGAETEPEVITLTATTAPTVSVTTETTAKPVTEKIKIIADRITAVQGAKALPYTVVLTDNPGYSRLSMHMSIVPELAAVNPNPLIEAGNAAPDAALTWNAGAGTVIGMTANGVQNTAETGNLLVYYLDIPEEIQPGRYALRIQVDMISDADGTSIPYEIEDGWIDITEPPRYAGDVNCDGKRTISDAVYLARLTVEDSTLTVKSRGIQNADCDGVAGLDIGDVTALLRFLAGILTELL